jgi:hypothetical protein
MKKYLVYAYFGIQYYLVVPLSIMHTLPDTLPDRIRYKGLVCKHSADKVLCTTSSSFSFLALIFLFGWTILQAYAYHCCRPKVVYEYHCRPKVVQMAL